MKQSRFMENRIVAIPGEAQASLKVNEVCRPHGISEATCFSSRARHGGVSVSELKHTKEPEAENAELKRVNALFGSVQQ